jgi:prepilin-type N-terminal cleavage/methylation domain-containing protein
VTTPRRYSYPRLSASARHFSTGVRGWDAATQRAFTLIELVVVITIFGIIMTVVGQRVGAFSFWTEEGFVRRLSETMTFLHHQAIADQSFYQIEFDLEKRTYAVGVVRADEDINRDLEEVGNDAGVITLELAAYLNPSVGRNYTVIPPPNFPSLAQPIDLPTDMAFDRIRTMRGVTERGKEATTYIRFSPRGFSEFAVINLSIRQSGKRTILINPFTGGTEIFREERDFKWTYGSRGKKSEDS